MLKKIYAIFLSLALCMMHVIPVFAADEAYVYDHAEVIAASSEQMLNDLAQEIYDTYDVRTVFILFEDETENEAKEAAFDQYDDTFGRDDGIILVVNKADDYFLVLHRGNALLTDDQKVELQSIYNAENIYKDGVEKDFEYIRSVYSGESTMPAQTIPDERLKPLLVDDADLLSTSEEEELLEKLTEISDRQNLDVAVVTNNDLGGKTATEYADDFFDYNGYGYGSNHDGILFLVSMDDRSWALSTTGYGIEAFTDAGQEYMTDRIIPYLSEGNYIDAFMTYADLCDQFIEQAHTGQPYDVGNMPKGKVPWFLLPINALFGLLVMWPFANHKKNKLKTVYKAQSAKAYLVPKSLKFSRKNDQFIGKHVTHVPHVDPNRGGGGHGGGGSSIHIGSSGVSHGGSSGHF